MALRRIGGTREDPGDRGPSVPLRRAASHLLRGAHLRGDPVSAGRRLLGRREDPRLVPCRAARAGMSTGSFFVPHDIAAPIAGRACGVPAGVTVAIKDMYDIAGSRTGGGNPEGLGETETATRHAGDA